jgi:hypothetical protein
VFSVATKLAQLRAKRGVAVLALVVLSVVGAKCGLPVTGMWDGPLGG